MYERFTDRARKVMQLANQEAQRLNHEWVEDGHILLAVITEGSGVGAIALKSLGVDLKQVRDRLEFHLPPGPNLVTMGKLPQTPAAKRVIEQAMHEARSRNHNYVGSEHMVLALVHEPSSIAVKILRDLGVAADKVKADVELLLGFNAMNDTGPKPGAIRIDQVSTILLAIADGKWVRVINGIVEVKETTWTMTEHVVPADSDAPEERCNTQDSIGI